MNYKYLRLNTGEHIISVVEPIKANQEVKLIMPMIADIVPSMLGQGTIMKLSPLIPYTSEDHIIMRLTDISYFSSITKQFVDFYKKAKATKAKKQSDAVRSDSKKHGVKFTDRKGSGRMRGGRKYYD